MNNSRLCPLLQHIRHSTCSSSTSIYVAEINIRSWTGLLKIIKAHVYPQFMTVRTANSNIIIMPIIRKTYYHISVCNTSNKSWTYTWIETSYLKMWRDNFNDLTKKACATKDLQFYILLINLEDDPCKFKFYHMLITSNAHQQVE